MIFGDREQFALEIEPLEPGWERISVSDRGPWARLAVYLKGTCLTRWIDTSTETTGSFVNVPLLPISSWLVENIRSIYFEESSVFFSSDENLHDSLSEWNSLEVDPRRRCLENQWEDERYEWKRRHFWLEGAEGAMLPDLAFVRSDDRLWVSWSKPRFAGPRKLEFTESRGRDVASWNVSWEALKNFTSYVAGESRARGLTSPSWIQNEGALETMARCSAEDYISIVAPEGGEILRALDIDPGAQPETMPTLQALRDLDVNSSTMPDVKEALLALRDLTNSPPSVMDIGAMRQQMFNSREIGPESAGYEAARALRSQWGLDGEPIPFEKLKELISTVARVREIEGASDGNSGASGFKTDGGAGIILLNHARLRHSWAKRMELARGLGHLLLDAPSVFGAMGAGSSKRMTGLRRKRSGAFAAEFNLPESGIRSLLGGRTFVNDDDFTRIMEKFEVGASTAAYHLWNHRIITTVEEREELIDRYSANCQT